MARVPKDGISRGGTYIIINNKTGRYYIGSTSQPFKKRWREHLLKLKKGKHHNRFVQRDGDKYGVDSFGFFELERIETYTEALLKEQVLLDTFISKDCYNTSKNSVNPMFGETHNTTTRQIIRKKVVAAWARGVYEHSFDDEYKKELGKRTKALWECDEYRQRVIESITGKKKSEIGKAKMAVSAQKRWESQSERDKVAGWKQKQYDGFVSPDGVIHAPVINMRKFCRDNKLDRRSMTSLDNGTREIYKGWTRLSTGANNVQNSNQPNT